MWLQHPQLTQPSMGQHFIHFGSLYENHSRAVSFKMWNLDFLDIGPQYLIMHL